MSTKVKCFYEDGMLKPIGDFNIEKNDEIIVEIIKKPAVLTTKNSLKDAYKEMADDNLRISREWDHLENEASRHIEEDKIEW